MADVYYRVVRQADRDLHFVRPGLGQPADRARQRLSRFGAVPGGDRQRSDQPVQSRRLPGTLSPLPGGLSLDRARLLQARVSADARRHGAARDAPGLEDDGDRTAGAGGARRAVRHLQGGGRRGDAEAGRMERQHLLPLRRRSGRRDQGRRHAAGRRAAGDPGRPGRAIRRRRSRPAAAGGAPAHSGRLVGERHSAPSTPIIPWRSGWWRATGPIRRTTPRAQADVLLALGVRFDDRTSSSWLPGYSFTIPPTKLIHVDIDPDEIAPQLPGRARADGGRAHLPAPAARPSSTARRNLGERADARAQMARRHRRLPQGMGRVRRAGLHR